MDKSLTESFLLAKLVSCYLIDHALVSLQIALFDEELTTFGGRDQLERRLVKQVAFEHHQVVVVVLAL